MTSAQVLHEELFIDTLNLHVPSADPQAQAVRPRDPYNEVVAGVHLGACCPFVGGRASPLASQGNSVEPARGPIGVGGLENLEEQVRHVRGNRIARFAARTSADQGAAGRASAALNDPLQLGRLVVRRPSLEDLVDKDQGSSILTSA